MAKNIEMNYLNSDGGYEALYPSTKMSNVSDWSSYVYSKSSVDSKISSLNSTINSIRSDINSDISSIENQIGNYSADKLGTFVIATASSQLTTVNKMYHFLYVEYNNSAYPAYIRIGTTSEDLVVGGKSIIILGANKAPGGYYLVDSLCEYNTLSASFSIYGRKYTSAPTSSSLTIYGIMLF